MPDWTVNALAGYGAFNLFCQGTLLVLAGICACRGQKGFNDMRRKSR